MLNKTHWSTGRSSKDTFPQQQCGFCMTCNICLTLSMISSPHHSISFFPIRSIKMHSLHSPKHLRWVSNSPVTQKCTDKPASVIICCLVLINTRSVCSIWKLAPSVIKLSMRFQVIRWHTSVVWKDVSLVEEQEREIERELLLGSRLDPLLCLPVFPLEAEFELAWEEEPKELLSLWSGTFSSEWTWIRL